jgi:hypothetical protein
MNALQEHGGIISDLCVNAREVSRFDQRAAINFLKIQIAKDKLKPKEK